MSKRKFEHQEAVRYVAKKFGEEFEKFPDLSLQASVEVLAKVFMIHYENFLIKKGIVKKEQFYEVDVKKKD